MFGERVTLAILEILFWIPVALSEGIVIATIYGD
jgi:hypothetical protein